LIAIMAYTRYEISNSRDIISDPLVLEFIDKVSGHKYFDFEDLTQKKYIKYWPHISIHRYENEDFTYVFYGSQLVNHIGEERTGYKISELPNYKHKERFFNALLEVLNTKKPTYGIGNVYTPGKEFKIWQQVKIPLQRNGEVNEVLSFFSFSNQT